MAWFESVDGLILPARRLTLLTLVSALLLFVTPHRSTPKPHYLLFGHALHPSVMHKATFISNSMHTTPPPRALRWVGRILADEAKIPKSGFRDGATYFATLTLFGSPLFLKSNFYPEVCCVAFGSCKLRTRVFRAAFPRIPGRSVV